MDGQETWSNLQCIEPLSVGRCLEIFESYQAGGRIPTGIAVLDESIGGGLPIGQVVTIVGYTGARKSETKRQIVRNIDPHRFSIIDVDVELGPAQLIERELCQTLSLAPSELKTANKGSLEAAKRAVAKRRDHVLTIQPLNALSQESIEKDLVEILRHEREQHPGKEYLICFDSAHRLAPAFAPGDTRHGVTNFMYWADDFSRRAKVAVLVTSEMSRPPKREDLNKEKQSIISALMSGAESRSIEFVSHTLLVLFPVYHDGSICAAATAKGMNRVRVMVAKSRSGPDGWLRSAFYFHRPCWGFTTTETLEDMDVGVEPKDGLGLGIEEAISIWFETHPGGRISADDLAKRLGRRRGVVSNVLHAMADGGSLVLDVSPGGRTLGWRRPRGILPKEPDNWGDVDDEDVPS